jgi:hypothetical protein
MADAVLMPLSPRILLALGRVGERPPPQVFLTGHEARQFARDVNAALVAQAYEWVAAHPAHKTFGDMTFPPQGPLIGICDGDSPMSRRLNVAPPHKWQRLGKDWSAQTSRLRSDSP